MKTKSQLFRGVLILSLIGVAFLSYPFIASMAPSTRTVANIPRIYVKNMKPGSYKIVTYSRSVELFNGFHSAVMLVKRKDGSIDAWYLSVKNGAVGMPDYHWWLSYFVCHHFGPTMVNDVIDETKPISCHDETDRSNTYKTIWRWSIDGKALSGQVEDMEKTKGIVEGDYFVFYRWR